MKVLAIILVIVVAALTLEIMACLYGMKKEKKHDNADREN